MNNNLYDPFQEIESKGRILGNYWNDFYEEVSPHLPDTYQPEMQELSQKLEQAIKNLIDEIRYPTLTLATTGTTSSGKSTLVNFLCGAEILPVANAEMSAGVVTVEYSDEKSLIIENTPGASWECGEWTNITEKEIRDRLYQVMISYIDNRENNNDLACPVSLVRYPFRILKELNLGLPHGTKVKILDLPGLAHVGDESNAEVIRQCREALCLVTYNSAETDKKKVENLLQEVVQQVKELGGSPARMIFILNRIDIFRTDHNWPDSENRFVDKTTQNIKNELIDQLKEYTTDIENLSVLKMSTWPALLSLQAKSSNEIEAISACKKADKYFNGLIDETLEELQLPRRHENWSYHGRNQVSNTLREKAYAQVFEQTLETHIVNYFPQLVIPQIIERFNVNAGNAVVEWALQTTNAVMNSSRDRYEKECEKIAQIRSSLGHFLEISDSNLRKPFEKVDTKFKEVKEGKSEEDPILYLEKVIKSELQEVAPYDSLSEELYPIYGWNRDLGKGINNVLEKIAESIKTGHVDLDDPYLKKISNLQVNLLERNLIRLIDLGYTNYLARNGGERIAKSDIEKKNLRELNDSLNELAINLNIVMKEVLISICDQASNRIYESVNKLFRFHLSYLEEGSSNISPQTGIKFPNSQLIKLEQKPKFTVQFQAGFPITEDDYIEAVEVERRVRVWYKMWLGKGTKKKIEYQDRKSDNASIPKIDNLLINWIDQGKNTQEQIVNETLSWLLRQIKILKKNVNDVQSDIIDRYQARLDKANQEIIVDYEKKKNVWEPISRKAQNLQKEFSTLKLERTEN